MGKALKQQGVPTFARAVGVLKWLFGNECLQVGAHLPGGALKVNSTRGFPQPCGVSPHTEDEDGAEKRGSESLCLQNTWDCCGKVWRPSRALGCCETWLVSFP